MQVTSKNFEKLAQATRQTFSPAATADRQVSSTGDADFVRMLEAFRFTGGLARAPEIAALMRLEPGHDFEILPRWVAHRRVLSFEWGGELWLPVFQFSRPSMTARPELTLVLNELAPAMSSWEVAVWFATPNLYLEGKTPVDVMRLNPDAVYQAARTESRKLRSDSD